MVSLNEGEERVVTFRKNTIRWDPKRQQNILRIMIISYRLARSQEKVKGITAVCYEVVV